ncbi:MAG TPA: protealysin inhibitor emfourin [Nitrososphaeraceae archaeon]|jgi:hypothetical protein
MKIRFESSGGFAGMYSSATIDTTLTNSQDAEKLEKLVRNSKFFELPSESSPFKSGSADYIRYKITVESEDKSHTVLTDDTRISPTLSPLIGFLRSRAKISQQS